MSARAEAGHRCVPHTADVRIEAWAPTREGCVAEAVAALVDSFADLSGATPVGDAAFHVGPGEDGDLLVGVLDEVIYRMDVEGRLPVRADVTAVTDGFDIRLEMTDTDRAEPVGAVPKAVALHELRFGREADGWTCGVTLDV
ncbi:archease [Micromonospora zhanjiangensis]|uniref:Archease n=1 Tax=Micromonospora zhanjiangensis TaxID=1522057 RepID=A0ABV8KJS2_9ACTN